MTSRHSCLLALILTGLLGLNGCISSGDPGTATTPDPEATSPDNGQDPDDMSATDTGSAGEDVVDDIPTIEMMSEIDGIEIPRLEGSNQQLTLSLIHI